MPHYIDALCWCRSPNFRRRHFDDIFGVTSYNRRQEWYLSASTHDRRTYYFFITDIPYCFSIFILHWYYFSIWNVWYFYFNAPHLMPPRIIVSTHISSKAIPTVGLGRRLLVLWSTGMSANTGFCFDKYWQTSYRSGAVTSESALADVSSQHESDISIELAIPGFLATSMYRFHFCFIAWCDISLSSILPLFSAAALFLFMPHCWTLSMLYIDSLHFILKYRTQCLIIPMKMSLSPFHWVYFMVRSGHIYFDIIVFSQFISI